MEDEDDNVDDDNADDDVFEAVVKLALFSNDFSADRTAKLHAFRRIFSFEDYVN